MINLGLPGEGIIKFFVEHEFIRYPRLCSLVKKYKKDIKDELFESHEACVEHVKKILSYDKSVPAVKINFIYAGKIMLDNHTRREFYDVIKEFVHISSITDKQYQFICNYIDNILNNQIVSFNAIENGLTETQTNISISKIEEGDYDSVDDLLMQDQQSLMLSLHRDAMRFINKKPLDSVENDVAIQDIYMTVANFGLMRECQVLNKKSS